jgi:quinol monooxygenase YgiN
MVILRFKIRSKPDKSDELMCALAEITTPARATNGVINFDIAGDLVDHDSFLATATYDDGAALEQQELLPEVDRVMVMLQESLVATPDRTIFDASLHGRHRRRRQPRNRSGPCEGTDRCPRPLPRWSGSSPGRRGARGG